MNRFSFILISLLVAGCVVPADYVVYVQGDVPSNQDCTVKFKGEFEKKYEHRTVTTEFNFSYVSNSAFGQQSLYLICNGDIVDEHINITSTQKGTKTNPIVLKRVHNKQFNRDK